MARDSEEARRLAADPTTDWGTLYELAQTNPEVHAALAANPATYPDLLAWLGSLGKPDVDAALSARAAADAGAPEPEPEPEPELDATVAAPAVRPDEPSPETQVIPAEEPRTPPAYAPAAAAAAARVPLTVERVPVAQTFGQQPTPVEPPPLEPEPPAEEAGSRRRLVAILVIVGILVIAGIAWLLGRGGDEPDAGPTAGPTATAPAMSSPTTPAPTATTPTADPQAALDAASVALADAVEGSACEDPATEAAAFTDFAAARLAVGAWGEDASATVGEVIGLLQSRCNAGYAVQVADRAGEQSPELARELGGRDWVVPTLPAPTGAADITAFSSPSGNIACVLGEDSVTCSIAEYSFGSPGSCTDRGAPVTAVIDATGARADCAAGAVTGGPALSYGTAARHSHFACTSERDGVTCWDTWTGARVKLARATFEVEGPRFGSAG